MRGLWQNRVRIFLSQMATRVEFSDSTRAAGCYPIGSSRRSKMSTGSPKYIDIRSLSGKCHPRLDPVTDQRSIACHPGPRSGISSFKRYLRPCPIGGVLLFWQKGAKTIGRNNHSADSLNRRLCKGGKACGRDDRYHERVMAESGSDFSFPDGNPSRVLGPQAPPACCPNC
jgi:hypothetical protein